MNEEKRREREKGIRMKGLSNITVRYRLLQKELLQKEKR